MSGMSAHLFCIDTTEAAARNEDFGTPRLALQHEIVEKAYQQSVALNASDNYGLIKSSPKPLVLLPPTAHISSAQLGPSTLSANTGDTFDITATIKLALLVCRKYKSCRLTIFIASAADVPEPTSLPVPKGTCSVTLQLVLLATQDELGAEAVARLQQYVDICNAAAAVQLVGEQLIQCEQQQGNGAGLAEGVVVRLMGQRLNRQAAAAAARAAEAPPPPAPAHTSRPTPSSPPSFAAPFPPLTLRHPIIRRASFTCRNDSLDSLLHFSCDGFMRAWLPSYANLPHRVRSALDRTPKPSPLAFLHSDCTNKPQKWTVLLEVPCGRMDVDPPIPITPPFSALPARSAASRAFSPAATNTNCFGNPRAAGAGWNEDERACGAAAAAATRPMVHAWTDRDPKYGGHKGLNLVWQDGRWVTGGSIGANGNVSCSSTSSSSSGTTTKQTGSNSSSSGSSSSSCGAGGVHKKSKSIWGSGAIWDESDVGDEGTEAGGQTSDTPGAAREGMGLPAWGSAWGSSTWAHTTWGHAAGRDAKGNPTISSQPHLWNPPPNNGLPGYPDMSDILASKLRFNTQPTGPNAHTASSTPMAATPNVPIPPGSSSSSAATPNSTLPTSTPRPPASSPLHQPLGTHTAHTTTGTAATTTPPPWGWPSTKQRPFWVAEPSGVLHPPGMGWPGAGWSTGVSPVLSQQQAQLQAQQVQQMKERIQKMHQASAAWAQAHPCMPPKPSPPETTKDAPLPAQSQNGERLPCRAFPWPPPQPDLAARVAAAASAVAAESSSGSQAGKAASSPQASCSTGAHSTVRVTPLKGKGVLRLLLNNTTWAKKLVWVPADKAVPVARPMNMFTGQGVSEADEGAELELNVTHLERAQFCSEERGGDKVLVVKFLSPFSTCSDHTQPPAFFWLHSDVKLPGNVMAAMHRRRDILKERAARQQAQDTTTAKQQPGGRQQPGGPSSSSKNSASSSAASNTTPLVVVQVMSKASETLHSTSGAGSGVGGARRVQVVVNNGPGPLDTHPECGADTSTKGQAVGLQPASPSIHRQAEPERCSSSPAAANSPGPSSATCSTTQQGSRTSCKPCPPARKAPPPPNKRSSLPRSCSQSAAYKYLAGSGHVGCAATWSSSAALVADVMQVVWDDPLATEVIDMQERLKPLMKLLSKVKAAIGVDANDVVVNAGMEDAGMAAWDQLRYGGAQRTHRGSSGVAAEGLGVVDPVSSSWRSGTNSTGPPTLAQWWHGLGERQQTLWETPRVDEAQWDPSEAGSGSVGGSTRISVTSALGGGSCPNSWEELWGSAGPTAAPTAARRIPVSTAASTLPVPRGVGGNDTDSNPSGGMAPAARAACLPEGLSAEHVRADSDLIAGSTRRCTMESPLLVCNTTAQQAAASTQYAAGGTAAATVAMPTSHGVGQREDATLFEVD